MNVLLPQEKLFSLFLSRDSSPTLVNRRDGKSLKEDERVCKREEMKWRREGERGRLKQRNRETEGMDGEKGTERKRGRGMEGGGRRERCYCSHLNSSTFRMNYSWATWTPVTSLPSKKTWKNREQKEKILECSFLIVRQRRGVSALISLGGTNNESESYTQSREEWGTPSHLPRLATL